MLTSLPRHFCCNVIIHSIHVFQRCINSLLATCTDEGGKAFETSSHFDFAFVRAARAYFSFRKAQLYVCVLVEVTAKLQAIHRDHDQRKVAATNSSHCIGFFTS